MGTIHEKVSYTEETKELLKTALNENGANVTDSDSFRSYVGQVPKVYEAGYKEGTKSEYDEFWDKYQNFGNNIRTQYLFAGSGWTNETLKPKYDIVIGDGIRTFAYMNFKGSLKEHFENLGISLITSESSSIQYLFDNCTAITETPHVIGESYADGVFNWCSALETASITLGKNSIYYSTLFNRCSSLKNLTIYGMICKDFSLIWATLLTKESLLSVLNALEDKTSDTSGTTWTLTIGSENIAKLDEETELSIAWQKGWVVN